MTMKMKRKKRKTEVIMRSPTRVALTALCGLWTLLAFTALSPAVADEGKTGAEPAPEALFYVVKVTPSLVYLDGGLEHGVCMGQDFLIMRQNAGQGYYVLVGEARVIRLTEELSIAEVTSVEEGEEISLLHRAVSREAWDHLAAVAASEGRDLVLLEPGADEMSAGPEGTRSVHIVGGADRSKGIDLPNGDSVNDASIGLRLAKTFAGRWRLSMTNRIAGEPLGREGADVTQLSTELDLHRLLGRIGRICPYLGVGVGFHMLTWDPDDITGTDDSASKVGVTAVGGLELPAGGDWTLLIEAGTQQVVKWDDTIDVGNTRIYLGLGRYF